MSAATITPLPPLETPRRRPKSPTTRPRLITIQEASVYLGIPCGSLRDLSWRGHLPRVTLPGSRR